MTCPRAGSAEAAGRIRSPNQDKSRAWRQKLLQTNKRWSIDARHTAAEHCLCLPHCVLCESELQSLQNWTQLIFYRMWSDGQHKNFKERRRQFVKKYQQYTQMVTNVSNTWHMCRCVHSPYAEPRAMKTFECISVCTKQLFLVHGPYFDNFIMVSVKSSDILALHWWVKARGGWEWMSNAEENGSVTHIERDSNHVKRETYTRGWHTYTNTHGHNHTLSLNHRTTRHYHQPTLIRTNP